jgi:hypothetical protein
LDDVDFLESFEELESRVSFDLVSFESLEAFEDSRESLDSLDSDLTADSEADESFFPDSSEPVEVDLRA